MKADKHGDGRKGNFRKLCFRKDDTSNSMDTGLQRATLEARRADRMLLQDSRKEKMNKHCCNRKRKEEKSAAFFGKWSQERMVRQRLCKFMCVA